MNNYKKFEEENVARREAAAARKNNKIGKADEKKSFSIRAVEAGLTTLSAACRADHDLALQVRNEAQQALHSGDIPRYMSLRGALPRAMAQAI